ncbi:MAG: sigma factor, partial [Planctomycetota bacterium]
MTCYPSQTANRPDAPDGRSRIRLRAEALLAKHGVSLEDMFGHAAVTEAGSASPQSQTPQSAALATALMDVFRRSSDADVFDCLVQWVGPQLYARVRSRLRSLGALYDPQEILQDTFVNIYRYPDRFLASRPGAFAAWSSTIVDNAIR